MNRRKRTYTAVVKREPFTVADYSEYLGDGPYRPDGAFNEALESESGGSVVTTTDTPRIVHGVAIGEDNVVTGMSGEETVYPRDVLEKATSKLDGKPVVKNHPGVADGEIESQPPVGDIIGEVIDTSYVDGTGLCFEAEIDDEEIAEKIERGRLDVSPVLWRALEKHTGSGATPVAEIKAFRDLGVVAAGASEDADIAAGPATAMSAAQPSDDAPHIYPATAEALERTFPQGQRSNLDGDAAEQLEVLEQRIEAWGDKPGMSDHVDELRDERAVLLRKHGR